MIPVFTESGLTIHDCLDFLEILCVVYTDSVYARGYVLVTHNTCQHLVDWIRNHHECDEECHSGMFWYSLQITSTGFPSPPFYSPVCLLSQSLSLCPRHTGTIGNGIQYDCRQMIFRPRWQRALNERLDTHLVWIYTYSVKFCDSVIFWDECGKRNKWFKCGKIMQNAEWLAGMIYFHYLKVHQV